MSYTVTNQDFVQCLSTLIAEAVGNAPLFSVETENTGDLLSDSRYTETEGGYFEMGLHEGLHVSELAPASNNMQIAKTKQDDIVKILWSFCIQVHKGLRQFASCLVLASKMIAVFEVLQESTGNCQHILSALKLVLCFPYSDLAEFGFLIPEICLMLKIKNGDTCLFVVSDTQNLQDFYSYLHRSCSQPPLTSSVLYCGKASLQEFVYQLMGFYHISSENTEIKGCFPVYLFCNSKTDTEKVSGLPEMTSDGKSCSKQFGCSALYSTFCKSAGERHCVFHPCWIFLTSHHLHIIQVDFSVLPGKFIYSENARSIFKLNQIPLASVLLHPTQYSVQQEGSFSDGYVLELILGYRFVTAVFILPHEKFHFLRVYSFLRTLLQDIKTIIIFKDASQVASVKNSFMDSVRHSPTTR